MFFIFEIYNSGNFASRGGCIVKATGLAVSSSFVSDPVHVLMCVLGICPFLKSTCAVGTATNPGTNLGAGCYMDSINLNKYYI